MCTSCHLQLGRCHTAQTSGYLRSNMGKGLCKKVYIYIIKAIKFLRYQKSECDSYQVDRYFRCALPFITFTSMVILLLPRILLLLAEPMMVWWEKETKKRCRNRQIVGWISHFSHSVLPDTGSKGGGQRRGGNRYWGHCTCNHDIIGGTVPAIMTEEMLCWPS